MSGDILQELEKLKSILDQVPGTPGSLAKRVAAARWLKAAWPKPWFKEQLEQLAEESAATEILKQILPEMGVPRLRAANARDFGWPVARVMAMYTYSMGVIETLGDEQPCSYCGELVSTVCQGDGHREGCTKTCHHYCMTAHWANVCRPASNHSHPNLVEPPRESAAAATSVLAHPALKAACFAHRCFQATTGPMADTGCAWNAAQRPSSRP